MRASAGAEHPRVAPPIRSGGQTGPMPQDRELEDEIRRLLGARATDATICPSDVARSVGDEEWRDLMEPVRQAARRLTDAGEVEITQGGQVVDITTARGPIRIRRRR